MKPPEPPRDPAPAEQPASGWSAPDRWGQTLGERVADRRRALGLTQAELADALTLTHQAVSKWERGESLPDVALLMPLADILQVTVDELLRGAADRPPSPTERAGRWTWPFRAAAPDAAAVDKDPDDVPAADAARPLPPPALPHILEMAPFLGTGDLDRLVLRLHADAVSWPEAAQLAPFVSRSTLDHLIHLLGPDTASLKTVEDLAPFVDPATLEDLLARVPAPQWTWEAVARLAPFVSSARLAAMVALSV